MPLVVVTHGWSYTFEDYDDIGRHLSSCGYVVMHHEANVGDGGPPATLDAAHDTLHNTEYLLANLESIGGGVLLGHVDARRIPR
jgi:predicted dienelactone hydrolase